METDVGLPLVLNVVMGKPVEGSLPLASELGPMVTKRESDLTDPADVVVP